MQEYASKESLAEKIKKTAAQFIGEFDDVTDKDSDLRLEGVDIIQSERFKSVAFQNKPIN